MRSDTKDTVVPFSNEGTAVSLSSEVAEQDRQQRLYAAILSSTPDLAYVFDLEHRFIYANDALLKMWGVEWEDARGKTCLELGYEPWHAEMHDREIEQVIATKQPVRGEVPYSGTAGRRFFDYIFVPVFGPDGSIEAVAGTTRDITDRVKEEGRVALIARTAELARVVTGPGEMLYSVAEAIGKHLGVKRCYFSEIDLASDREKIFRDFCRDVPSLSGIHTIPAHSAPMFDLLKEGKRAVNDGTASDREISPRRKKTIDNGSQGLSYIAIPLMRQGHWVASLVATHDEPRSWSESDFDLLEIIAERTWLALEKLRSETALRESEERFSKAFNSSPLAVTITSLATGKLIEVNDTFSRVTGYTREEAVGRSTAELRLWAQEGDREAELAAVSQHGTIRNHQYVFRTKDGTEVIGLLSAELLDIGGQQCALTVIQDITDRVSAERAVNNAAARYRNLFESIDEGFCIIEILFDEQGRPRDCRFIEASPSFEKQSGIIDPIGKTVREVLPDEGDQWVSIFGKVALTGESSRSVELGRSTGRWFDIYAFRIGDDLSQVAVLFSDVTARKRAELALHESEGRFRLVADAAPVLIWSANGPGTRNWFNRSWLNFTGKTIDEEEGTGWQNGVHPEDIGRYLDVLNVAFESREGFETEFRLQRADGDYRWVLDRGVPRVEADGYFTGFIGSCTDITDRKTAEQSLTASKAELELVFTRTPFMLTHCSADLRYRYVSRSYAEFFGRKPKDFVDVAIVEILGRDAFEKIRPQVETVLSGVAVEFETPLELKGVGQRHLAVSYVPVYDSENAVSGWISSIVDITERKLAEGLLERYRLLSEESTDMIWFARPDGSFVDVNRAAVETYGYTRDEFLSMNIRSLRHPDTLNELDAQLAGAEKRGIHFETVHIRKDGTSIPVEVKANGGDFGGERLVMSIIRDITQRKKAESELLESEERRQMAEEAGNVGIWDWDVSADHTYWSETMWQFYGETPGSTNPDEEYWSRHLHANDRERVKENLQKALNGSQDLFKDEFRIVRHDGSIRWIEAKASITRDAEGNAVRVCGVNLDITERKEAEERVRLSEYQLRVVTNAVPALISYVDSRERYRFVNHKYIEWFGQRPNDLIGKKVKDVVGAAAYREMKPRIDEALSGIESTFETLLEYKNAGSRYVHVSFVPDIGIDGTVHGYYGLTHDLTDLKRSEDLLRSSEERMGMLMESFTDYAIMSMDAAGYIDSWNKGAEIIFGYTQDEAIGRSGDIIFTPEDVKNGMPEKERKTARKKGRASDERWHIRKDGSRFFASGVLMPLYVGKRLSGFAKIASDLTEKKRRAEELQRAHDELELRVKERTKELAESNLALVKEMEEREVAEGQRIDLLRRLVSSQEFERRRIARDLHDQLGQRLTALRLKIASLKDTLPGDAEFPARVQRLQEIAERLDSEVSFLAWELRPSALDDLGLTDAIGAFVNEWSKHYEIEADFYSANLSSDRMSRDAETHLYRITQEALNNIAKHAQATEVTVILERRGDNVILILEDNGVGFEPPATEKMPSESGKGLGLLGMRERASLVGGTVEIESAPGKGTAIYVKVPFSV